MKWGMSDRRADKDWCAPRGLDLRKRPWLSNDMERFIDRMTLSDTISERSPGRESKRRANDTLTWHSDGRQWETGGFAKPALHPGMYYCLCDKSGTSQFRCTFVSAFGISPASRSRVNERVGTREMGIAARIAWLPGVTDLVRAISRQSDFSLAHIETRAKPRKLVSRSRHSFEASSEVGFSDWFDSTDAEIRAERRGLAKVVIVLYGLRSWDITLTFI